MIRRETFEGLAGVIVTVLWLLFALNPELAQWGDAFAPNVPVEDWFQHRLQWDAVIGCGTELCR